MKDGGLGRLGTLNAPNRDSPFILLICESVDPSQFVIRLYFYLCLDDA